MVANNTKPVIIAGFSIILLFFIILILFWVSSQSHQQQRLVKMDAFREAARHIGDMRKVSLRRALALHEMLLMTDEIDRDEKYQEFSELAGAFIDARDKLLALDLDQKGLSLWEKIRLKVIASQRVQVEAVRVLQQGSYERVIDILSDEVIPWQQQIADTLSEMFDYNNEQVAQEFTNAEADQRKIYSIIVILTVLALLISSGIIFYVVRTTARIQNDLRKADEARFANQMKSEFLANMSHEIRTPLTAIIGYAEAALNPGQNRQERMDGIQTIHQSGMHLLSLINEILDLSKVEAGKLELELMQISPFEILQDVSHVSSCRVQEKGLNFGLNYKYPLPASITTDPLRLKQILLNLINNAIKFTEKGHIYINVSCDSEQQKLYFAIEDTGIGIATEKMSNIFESFSQADKSTTRKYGGTGLGLTLSRRLAGMLGGSINADSLPGKGSVFTVSIDTGPLQVADFIHQESVPIINTENDNKVVEMPVLQGKVLVVDDVEANRKLISYFVGKTGVQVDLAGNGQQALGLLEQTSYDLVFMDMQMPVMDGITATENIRARHWDVPVIMLTANAYPEDRRRCAQAGANDFLCKPVSNQQINEILMQFLPADEQLDTVSNPICSTLLEEDPELADIVNRFVHCLPQRSGKLDDLFQRQDWSALGDQLHDLKGTAGNMGFGEIYSHLVDMEDCLRGNDYGQLGGSV